MHTADLVTIAAVVAVAATGAVVLRSATLGAALRLTATAPAAAERIGVDTARIRAASFAVERGACSGRRRSPGRSPLPARRFGWRGAALRGIAAAAAGGMRSPRRVVAAAVVIAAAQVVGGSTWAVAVRSQRRGRGTADRSRLAAMIRRLLLLGGAAVVATFVYPIFASAPNLDRAAVALALAGPTAGRRWRPLRGVHRWWQRRSPAWALHQRAVGAARLSRPGLGGDRRGSGRRRRRACGTAVRAPGRRVIPGRFALARRRGRCRRAGAAGDHRRSVGFGPPAPLSIPLGATKSAVLTPLGDFHALLAAAALSAALAALMLSGAGWVWRWRAVGSDRARAAASGLRPLVSDATALALAGLLAALSGALAAHVTRLASTDSFAPDVAALHSSRLWPPGATRSARQPWPW